MILVLGSSGQVALELKRLPGVVTVGRPNIDFYNLTSISEVIELTSASAVIHASAYTAIDTAESEADVAKPINASALGEVAGVCGDRDIPLVQLCTDYVFDGKNAILSLR